MILFRALHKQYIPSWGDYEKGSSYKHGARWNQAGTPVIYFSLNPQNAMLELSNYAPSASLANGLFAIGVFESPSLRLKEVQPEDLSQDWEHYPFHPDTQRYGSDVLLNDAYDGLIVPSCAINTELASSAHNEVRRSVFANVVMNPEKEAAKKMTLMRTYSPIYSNRMFND